MPIDYHEVKRKSKETGARTLKIYPPVLISKRNSKSAFSIKIFDTEMMRDILADNFFLNDAGIGQLTIDVAINPETQRAYTYIPTKSLECLHGELNPNFHGFDNETREKILNGEKIR